MNKKEKSMPKEQFMKIIKGTIMQYNAEGHGIIEVDNKHYAFKNTYLGDFIEFSYNSKTNEAKLLKIIKDSPHRTMAKCKIFKQCGGCTLQDIKYDHQLQMKQMMVQSLFDQSFNRKYYVEKTLGMRRPYSYRNKNQIVFGNDPKLKIISGFYLENTHKIINYDHCDLQDEITNKIIVTIKDIMIKLRLQAYHEDRKTGLIRHIMIKRSFTTNETMVIIITGQEVFPGRANFLKILLARHSEITTVIHNVNSRKTSAVLGEKETILFGKGYIIDELNGLKFKVSSKSFYQVNPVQTTVLYHNALIHAKLNKTDTLLDAYSGVGTIGLFASPMVDKVICVELVRDAHLDAITNAKMNNIKNVRFFNEDAGEFITNIVKRKEKIDVVVMDPPRRGSDEKFMQALLKLMPRKIVYISCNPLTQVNDLQVLIGQYAIEKIIPVDMFPQTKHIETIVLMARIEK